MLPIHFPEANSTLTGQKDKNGKSLDNVLDLPTFRDGTCCVSCWGLTEFDESQLVKSGSVWVWLWNGPTQPAIQVSALNPIGRDYLREAQQRPVLWTDWEVSVSEWPLLRDEIEVIQYTGHFWFTIQSGITQPPVGFSLENPFTEP